jgi:hypothetical protein
MVGTGRPATRRKVAVQQKELHKRKNAIGRKPQCNNTKRVAEEKRIAIRRKRNKK